jgi:alanine racemase
MRPTWVEVHLERLRENLNRIRAQVRPAKVMVVLKANAYGHGITGVAPFIAPFADWIGVALLEEGIALREMGITTPILVMGAPLSAQIPLFAPNELALTIPSSEILEAAEQAGEAAGVRIRAHLKIDTGMERIGVRDYESELFLERALRCEHVEVEGIYTHFANSEASDLSHAKLQMERFNEVLRFYGRRSLPPPPLRHAANSGAILQLPESYLDMVRPGITFYGVYPSAECERTVHVQPALEWKSNVVHSKRTRPDRPVSYGSLWQPKADATVVTIPCGYGDGYFRVMTNHAQAIVNGKKYAQVGRICMDQFMVNLGQDQAKLGDEVVLLGKAAGLQITADDMAGWAGTNAYEVLTNINSRVPRIYLSD